MSERHESGDSERGEPPADERRRRTGPGDWLALATVRWALALVGLVVVLFALGRAFGVPLLAWFAEALTSRTGRWLVVAFVGLLIVATALRLRPR